MRKTKIVCTIGPASKDKDILSNMILSGMDVARLNFSHGTHEEQKENIDLIKEVRAELSVPLAIMQDTKGPEIRLCTFKDDKVSLIEGNMFTLYTKEIEGDETGCSITYPNLVNDVSIGNVIMLDDGKIELTVKDITADSIVCKIINGGSISNRKGINVPGIVLSMPFLSERDKADLKFGAENGVDLVAASFTRRPDDIKQMRQYLDSVGGSDIGILAKIENYEGVENIDGILNICDGIMVARGDLGVEVPFEQLPKLQKDLISKAYRSGKRVITATQMLESMISSPRPTRAEISDVANAIYDGTSAIMLSGETAMGQYPVEVVKTMATIAVTTEHNIDYKRRFFSENLTEQPTSTNAISHAACTTAIDLGAKAIITVTKSGDTAKLISKYRPVCPILTCTPSVRTYHQMSLSWGVHPILVENMKSTDELFNHTATRATEEGYLEQGDLVVITAGVPLGVSGTTNLLKVHLIGNILSTGKSVGTGIIGGNLCVCTNNEMIEKDFKKGDILVVTETDNSMMSYLKKAKAIICEEDSPNCHSAVVGLSLDIPVIYGAKNATQMLTSGTAVTVDLNKGVIY